MASIGATARAQRGPVGLLYLFLITLIVLSVGMMVEKLNMSAEHAIQAHGEDAVDAAKAIGDGGFNRYHGDDGRDRLVKSVKNGRGWKWAIVVLKAGQEIRGMTWEEILDVCITSFMTSDRDYVAKLIEFCKPELNGGHP
ncbi:MAG TPA: hypothetical protein VM537_02905 [Anaerolineae bacterium]|nr:hypothetical protein [Anaerolineae bacterium]